VQTGPAEGAGDRLRRDALATRKRFVQEKESLGAQGNTPSATRPQSAGATGAAGEEAGRSMRGEAAWLDAEQMEVWARSHYSSLKL
jgi:hypothetical protein